nr:membrane biogenesis protein [Bacteroidota bacterium]
NVGNYKTTVQGSNGIDGSLDYKLKMDIPGGAAGAALNNALASISGNAATGGSNIKLNLKVGGTYEDPKFGLAGAEAGESVQQQTKAAIEQRVNQEVDKAKEEFDARKKEAEEKARQEVEQKREEVEQKANQEVEKAKEQVKEQAKGKVKDFLKKP